MIWDNQQRSIRSILTSVLLLVGTGLMAVAWAVHGTLLDRMTESIVSNQLKSEVDYLKSRLIASGGLMDELPSGDYFEEFFHHSFAIRSQDNMVYSSGSLTDALLSVIQEENDGIVRASTTASEAGSANILAYRESFGEADEKFVVVVAQDLTVLGKSQQELHLWTAIVSITLLSLFIGLIWVAINFALRPVLGLEKSLKNLQDGTESRLNERVPSEFRMLVRQLNQLLGLFEKKMEISNNSMANLSHGIKTPISVAQALLGKGERGLTAEDCSHISRSLESINFQLDSEMRRNRFSGIKIGRETQVIEKARDLLWMLGQIYPTKSFEFKSSLDPNTRWPLHEHQFNEIVGNLVDNAGKWGAHFVELFLGSIDQGYVIRVTDDGPGVPNELIDQLGSRGLRLDEQIPGHGLGLAIVRSAIEPYDGELSLSSGPTGGFCATVVMASGKTIAEQTTRGD